MARLLRIARWVLGGGGVRGGQALGLLLALGLLVSALAAMPGESGARGRTAQAKTLRYRLFVTYTGRWYFRVDLGENRVTEVERVSTWTAGSVTPFTLRRTGTAARPRYRFSTKVRGLIEHRGRGRTVWYDETPTGTMGPCEIGAVDSNVEGNGFVRGTFSAQNSRIRFSGYDPALTLPRVMTTIPAYACPLTVKGTTVDLGPKQSKVERCRVGCPVMPQAWSPQTVAAKKFKFGRKFTLKFTSKRADLLLSNPMPSLNPLPAGTLQHLEYTYVLTFTPVSSSR